MSLILILSVTARRRAVFVRAKTMQDLRCTYFTCPASERVTFADGLAELFPGEEWHVVIQEEAGDGYGSRRWWPHTPETLNFLAMLRACGLEGFYVF